MLEKPLVGTESVVRDAALRKRISVRMGGNRMHEMPTLHDGQPCDMVDLCGAGGSGIDGTQGALCDFRTAANLWAPPATLVSNKDGTCRWPVGVQW